MKKLKHNLAERVARLLYEQRIKKLMFAAQPYTQKIYNKEDLKNFPNDSEKWRVIKTITHKFRETMVK